ncbi:MAG: TLD domain-containing protein, partial [Promethearchaeia archaeon]
MARSTQQQAQHVKGQQGAVELVVTLQEAVRALVHVRQAGPGAMANSLLGPLRSALKFVLGDTQANAESEALQGLGEGEAAALRVGFSRVAALRPDPTSIDPVSLAAELRIPEGLGDRLFRAIQLQAKAGHHGDVKPGATETSDEAGRAATMTLVTMARGLCEICTPSRESQIEFLLSVLGDDCGFVSRERCRELLCVMIEHALPLERADDTDLRDRLVRMSLDLAWTFAQASSEKGLTPDEAERWLQEDTEARACLSNLLRAHFLRLPDGHGQVDEEKRKLPRLRRRSLLLSDELLWLLSPCLSEQCLARPWKRLFCSVRHGQSFARLVSRVVFKGPTLLAIKDTGGHVFGVFAPVSWHKDNKFFGTSQT